MNDYLFGLATGVVSVIVGLVMWYKYMDYIDELERGTKAIRVDYRVPRVHVDGNLGDCST